VKHYSNCWDGEILHSSKSLTQIQEEMRCDMKIGQFEVKFSDDSTLKVNCADITQAANIATGLKPLLEIISIAKIW